VIDGNMGIELKLYFTEPHSGTAGLTTIFQSIDKMLYLFTKAGAFQVADPEKVIRVTDFHASLLNSTWVLIDSNRDFETVPHYIEGLKLFVVQAASPRTERVK
jgi:hypothetical protein